MRKTSGGFTLIELVVVITILGILAAFALPRFASLQTEARIAKMQAAMGSIKSAAAMAHSLQLAQQKPPNESVVMEGLTVVMSSGYPSGVSIGEAAGLTENGIEVESYKVLTKSNNSFVLAADAKRSGCIITYTRTLNVDRPVYGASGLTVDNCK